MTTTVQFSRATVAQLAKLATTVLGLEVEANDGKDSLRAKIAAAGFTADKFELEDDTDIQPTPELTLAAVAGRKMIKINIPMHDGVGGQEAVPVGVNGKVARIMRGVDVKVPVEYVEVLTNATKTVYDRGPNMELINPRLVPSIPFSIIGR